MLKLATQFILAVVMCFAAARLAFVASNTESGWQFIETQWQDATLGHFGLEHIPIGSKSPSQQASFWLPEVQRIVKMHPDSASVHMGAAWVLDSADIGFLQNYIKQSDFARAFPSMGLQFDNEAISSEQAKFREKCVEQCLLLAKTATQLEPNDVRWWRMRALLLFEGDSLWSGKDFEPRSNDWLEVIEKCRKHDPDNALYDYLVAVQLWNRSASYDFPIRPEEEIVSHDTQDETDSHFDMWLLTIQDANEFAIATKRFLEGQKKAFLSIGEAGYPSVTDFLEHSHLRVTDQAKVAISRLLTFRHSTLFSRLWRWQNVRADSARRANDSAKEIKILLQNFQLFDQTVTPKETSALNILNNFDILRHSTYKNLEKHVNENPLVVEQIKMADIRQREEELRIETATLQLALQKLDANKKQINNTALLPTFLSYIACTSAAALLALAAVLQLMSFVLTKNLGEIPNLGFFRHAIAWTIGCGGTFVVLGMAPAEMIEHEIQRLTIITCIWSAAIFITIAAVWFVVTLLRLRKLRFRLVTLFAVTTAVAVLASLWPLIQTPLSRLAENPSELWVHANGWNEIDPEVILSISALEKETWYWAALQWFLHGGHYFGLAFSLLLAVFWFMRRIARSSEQKFFGYWTQQPRTHCSLLCRFAAKSTLVAALGFLFFYFYITPTAVSSTEAEFQYQMQYCRDPITHWGMIRDAQADIESSENDMRLIREQVHFELYGKGVLEKDFGSK